MSRRFDRTALPPLPTVLPRSLAPDNNNRQHAIREIRALAQRLRTTQNISFYSMRTLASHLQMPLRTIAIAFEQLEAEGLLLRLRGSHTKLLGHQAETLQRISGVIGLPVWIFGFRHFVYRRSLARLLGGALWQHAISTDTILYWEYEDLDHDFVERLLRHRIDVLVWFQPLRHNLDAIAQLKDRGVRSLVIGDLEISNVPAQIGIDWQPAYDHVLTHWKTVHRIRKIIVVEGAAYTTARLRYFEEIAARHGLDCRRLKSSPELPAKLARKNAISADTAIALFDDHSSTEFSLRDPDAFLKLAHRHRILFAREIPSIAYAAPGSFSCERLAFPSAEIVQATADTVLAWRAGAIEPPPIRLAGLAFLDWESDTWM